MQGATDQYWFATFDPEPDIIKAIDDGLQPANDMWTGPRLDAKADLGTVKVLVRDFQR